MQPALLPNYKILTFISVIIPTILLLSPRHGCRRKFSLTRYCQIHTTSTEETWTVQLRQKNKKCHCGGALVAVSSTYCSKHRLDLETDLEIVWTQMRLVGHKLYLGCVYVPTWSDVNTWSELDKSIELVYNAMNPDWECVLLCGNFNHRDIEWTLANNTIGLMPHSWTNPQSELCLEMSEYGLVQCNEDPTYNKHILDLNCVHDG